MIHRDFKLPPYRRPYQYLSAISEERVIYTADRIIKFRQVGWHGGSGRFYDMSEDPSLYEPASFAPLWVEVQNDVIIRDE